MESKELIEYIQSQINNKISKEEIIKVLKEQGGWAEKDINDAFSVLEQNIENQNPTVKKPEEKIEQSEIQPEAFEKKTSNRSLQIIVAVVVLAIISVGGHFGIKYFSAPTDSDEPVAEEVEDNGTVEELAAGVEIREDGVYYMDEFIESADSKTFEIIGENDDGFLYAKDSAMVYRLDFFEFPYSHPGIPEIGRLKEPNPETFVLLGDSLSKDKNKFYYRGVSVPEGDLDSFVCVGEAKTGNIVPNIAGMYCKDKNKVYCLGRQSAQILNQLDAESFEMIGENGQYPRFFVDKNAVYTPDHCNSDGIEILQDVDPVAFKEEIQFIGAYFSSDEEKLSNVDVLLYAKDSERIYCGEKSWHSKEEYILAEVDMDTFESLIVSEDGIIQYAKDKNAVYLGCTRFDFLDPDSFEILEEEYARDKNAYYYKHFDDFRKIEGVDPNSFIIVNDSVSKDKNHVYWENKILEKADPETFEVIEIQKNDEKSYYGKDANHIYIGDKILESADPETFEVLNKGYSKDKNHIYLEFSIVDADPETFEIIEGWYFKDKDTIYFQYYPIDDVDTETFEILSEVYSKDKNYVFYRGHKIYIYPLKKGQDKRTVSPDTFIVLENEYAKDNLYVYKGKSMVYYREDDEIIMVDSETFENLDFMYVKDKNNIYQEGRISDEEGEVYVIKGINPEECTKEHPFRCFPQEGMVVDGLMPI